MVKYIFYFKSFKKIFKNWNFLLILIKDKTSNKNDSFELALSDPEGGSRLGKITKAIVTVINDDGILFLVKIIKLR